MEEIEAIMAEDTGMIREEEAVMAMIITEETEMAITEAMDIMIEGETGMVITEAKVSNEMRITSKVEVMGSALTEIEVHQLAMTAAVAKIAILLTTMQEEVISTTIDIMTTITNTSSEISTIMTIKESLMRARGTEMVTMDVLSIAEMIGIMRHQIIQIDGTTLTVRFVITTKTINGPTTIISTTMEATATEANKIISRFQASARDTELW